MKHDDTAPRSAMKRNVRRASYILFAAAAVAVVYPWATSLYTWKAQRELRAEVPHSVQASEAATAHASTEATGKSATEDPFEGWEEQDLAYWKGLKNGESMGVLKISRIGLDRVVVKGAGDGDLMRGPGWLANTDFPGRNGNVGISGHRTTYGAPFGKLGKLKQGDAVTFTSPYRVYTYKVVSNRIVDPKHVKVMEYSEQPFLTLSTCHPPYSDRYRLVVQAILVSVKRTK